MNSLWLAHLLQGKRLAHETDEYLRKLSQEPLLVSRRNASALLTQLRQEPGPAVDLGRTTWGEPVVVPLQELVAGTSIITGSMGSGKTMFACLMIESLVRQLPHAGGLGFGVLDAKGELFERAIYLLGRRLDELNEQDREALQRRLVIINFSPTDPVTSYNLLAPWPYTDHDFFLTSRLETLRDLLPAGEKLSLRGAAVLRHVLMLLSEFGLPITYLDLVLSSEALRSRLLSRSQREEVHTYFRHHFPKESRQTIEALRARMESLFSSEGVRLALSGSSAPDFRRLQNEGKIVLVNCAGPNIARGVRLLLQGLVLSDIRQAIFARPHLPPVNYLWFADEAQNLFLTRQMQDNIFDVCTMGRSHGSFFSFLTQNLSTAVPDHRILETLYTNIRWAMTMRSTPNDAAFLKAVLPVTGRRLRPELNPFREPGAYSLEEERTLLLNRIAHLPDRMGYFWFKAGSPETIQIETRELSFPSGEAFRETVDAMRRDVRIDGRLSRADYDRLIVERDREWLQGAEESHDLQERMEKAYRRLEEEEA